MIFQALCESAERGELILTWGGILRYHQRRDGTVTILEILTIPEFRGKHFVGLKMLVELTKRVGADKPLVAKCPVDLEANQWYKKRGFVLERIETIRTGKKVNVWRRPPLRSSSIVPTATPLSLPLLSNSAGSTAPDSPPPSTSGSGSPTRTGSAPTGSPT